MISLPWLDPEVHGRRMDGEERRDGRDLTCLVSPLLGLEMEQICLSLLGDVELFGDSLQVFTLTKAWADGCISTPTAAGHLSGAHGLQQEECLSSPNISLISLGDSISQCSWPLKVWSSDQHQWHHLGAPFPDLLNQSLHFSKTSS